MTRMPFKAQYNLVTDDALDSRIPLHTEEAFKHGIEFQAKYIGTLDVPRPSSRVEIVAAMRRIRYEFKAKAIKKKKVDITVATNGVKVCVRRKRQKKGLEWDESHFLVMHHPIYRIFYVSHDSQDLKIFSYIARDGSTNVFKCNVFKAYKKSQAMRIVRTVGQAFEVCHKMSVAVQSAVDGEADAGSERSMEETELPAHSTNSTEETSTITAVDTATHSPAHTAESHARPADLHPRPTDLHPGADSPRALPSSISMPCSLRLPTSPLSPQELGPAASDTVLPISQYHQVELLRQQFEQQVQQTEVAVAQVQLLRAQLGAEAAARAQAQARTGQLMKQNRELLQHINTLVGRLRGMESRVCGLPLSPSGPEELAGRVENGYFVPGPRGDGPGSPLGLLDTDRIISLCNDVTSDEEPPGAPASLDRYCRLQSPDRGGAPAITNSVTDSSDLTTRLDELLNNNANEFIEKQATYDPRVTSPLDSCGNRLSTASRGHELDDLVTGKVTATDNYVNEVSQYGNGWIHQEDFGLTELTIREPSDTASHTPTSHSKLAEPVSEQAACDSEDDRGSSQDSADSGVPRPPRRIDSMTFDEFEALAAP